MSVATTLLIRELSRSYAVDHLDTRDERDLRNIGRFEFRNVMLALVHGAAFLVKAITRRPDVVIVPIAQNTVGYLRDLLFLLPARWLRIRVVVHLHGSIFRSFYEEAPGLMRWLIRYSLRRCAAGIVLGTNLRPIFDGLIPPERVFVAPNGLPDAAIDTSCREPRTVLFIGALTPRKGLHTALRAFAQVRDRFADARFVAAGSWARSDDRGSAVAIVRELELGSSVEFVGPVEGDAKAALFSRASVYVLPTVDDGLPYTILEAMRASMAVVASPVGAIPEVVEHGRTGCLVAPTPTEVADALSRLFRDEDLSRATGRAGRDRFLERFEVTRWASTIFDVIETVRR